MNNKTVEGLAKVLDVNGIKKEEAVQIMRVCAKMMGEILVCSDLKTEGKIKDEFDIKQKYEELNQRMGQNSPFDMFSNASVDGQRFILEWVLGQHDNDPKLEDLLK